MPWFRGESSAEAEWLASIGEERMAKSVLTIPLLCQEAAAFAEVISTYPEPTLYGVTDGKAVGTYLELTISNALQWRLQYARVIEEAGKVDGVLKLR